MIIIVHVASWQTLAARPGTSCPRVFGTAAATTRVRKTFPFILGRKTTVNRDGRANGGRETG